MAMTQIVEDRYALYNGDCCEVLPSLPTESVGMSIYSPPFGGLYHYSSSDRDLSNAGSYEAFLDHYAFVVAEIARLTKPGRLTVVHCADVPTDGHYLRDLPGDIVKMHERFGLRFHDRKTIWKEPLKVAIRTRALGLRHSQIVKDSSMCRSALGDYILAFRKEGTNKEPIAHPEALTHYAGELDPVKRVELGYAPIPPELLAYRDWNGDPNANKLSHWIWRRYASCVWSDVRIGRVLPYRSARESEEEKHVHPLQLDVIERCLTLWSNPDDAVLTPFMGVGSEVYAAVGMGRRGIGIELKASYFRQAAANMNAAGEAIQEGLFDEVGYGEEDAEEVE